MVWGERSLTTPPYPDYFAGRITFRPEQPKRQERPAGSGFFLLVFLTLRLAIAFFGFFAFFSLLAFFVTLFRRFSVFFLNSRCISVCSRGSSISGENNGREGQRNKSGGDSGQDLFIWCYLHFACFGICSKFMNFFKYHRHCPRSRYRNSQMNRWRRA